MLQDDLGVCGQVPLPLSMLAGLVGPLRDEAVSVVRYVQVLELQRASSERVRRGCTGSSATKVRGHKARSGQVEGS